MSGYTESEVIGRNCRFLQQRPSTRAKKLDMEQQRTNDEARREIRQRIPYAKEAQVKLVNYKKTGEKFENVLTIVPIIHDGIYYIVGFQFNLSEASWLK